ncbi:MAG: hypothetical protein ACRCWG_03150 [Sarcina sp.]
MEVKKKSNKAVYFVKGFLIFLMMGFGIEIGDAIFDGVSQDEYDVLNREYQTSAETLSEKKEDLEEIDSNIAGTKFAMENVKKAIEEEK